MYEATNVLEAAPGAFIRDPDPHATATKKFQKALEDLQKHQVELPLILTPELEPLDPPNHCHFGRTFEDVEPPTPELIALFKADKKIDQAKGKADLGLIPLRALFGASRVFSYGAKKYAEGNFYEAFLEDGAGRRYISALLRHCSEMQEPNGLHTPSSLAERDEESGLPHIDHAICGLLMLRSIMTKDGALPVDPGV